jgi:hypothetical protein
VSLINNICQAALILSPKISPNKPKFDQKVFFPK